LLCRALVKAFGVKPVIICPEENRKAVEHMSACVGLHLREDLQELKDMGFDEVLLTNVCLPANMAIAYSQPMSATPDSVSAVSSMCRYLRQEADEIGIYLSAELDGTALRENKSKDKGQDPEFFFKVFDRVYVRTNMDYYVTDVSIAKELCATSSRLVVAVDGFTLPSGSYFVR
ncbi:MAG: hypothetical protein J6P94_00330, partial [Oscillospiraceae bacterium]|nr:hypothetical protein [Oscillospiraceae bacterium]